MIFRQANKNDFHALCDLQRTYKQAIGESAPTMCDFQSLKTAIEEDKIKYFVCEHEDNIIAMCSICKTFSTFNYQPSGIFEDFFIVGEYRHKGIAKKLVRFAYEQSNVATLIVGCADCDIELYKALGFKNVIGNMLSYAN